jgi:hypothetical protein
MKGRRLGVAATIEDATHAEARTDVRSLIANLPVSVAPPDSKPRANNGVPSRSTLDP